MKLAHIPIHQVTLPPLLHRAALDADELSELARSIATVGLLNPITVRPVGDAYELIAGHRRYLACAQLGWTTIPSMVHDGPTMGDAVAEFARIVENLHRANLTPIEEAIAIARLDSEQGLTIEEIARTVHRSAGWVRERLQLAALGDELRELVHQRALSIRAALLLAEVTDDAHRHHLTRYAMHDGVSVPVLRAWVTEWHNAQASADGTPAPLPQMPSFGQPVIILVPCFLCRTPTPHTHSHAVRICPECANAATQPAPSPDHASGPTREAS